MCVAPSHSCLQQQQQCWLPQADVRADLSPRPNHYRTNFDELVNTDTSHSSGICKVAAKQFARYIGAAGFSREEVRAHGLNERIKVQSVSYGRDHGTHSVRRTRAPCVIGASISRMPSACRTISRFNAGSSGLHLQASTEDRESLNAACTVISKSDEI